MLYRSHSLKANRIVVSKDLSYFMRSYQLPLNNQSTRCCKMKFIFLQLTKRSGRNTSTSSPSHENFLRNIHHSYNHENCELTFSSNDNHNFAYETHSMNFSSSDQYHIITFSPNIQMCMDNWKLFYKLNVDFIFTCKQVHYIHKQFTNCVVILFEVVLEPTSYYKASSITKWIGTMEIKIMKKL